MKGKCKYCKVEINKSNIRCDSCNRTWNDGFGEGKVYIKIELKKAYNDIVNLIGE